VIARKPMLALLSWLIVAAAISLPVCGCLSVMLPSSAEPPTACHEDHDPSAPPSHSCCRSQQQAVLRFTGNQAVTALQLVSIYVESLEPPRPAVLSFLVQQSDLGSPPRSPVLRI